MKPTLKTIIALFFMALCTFPLSTFAQKDNNQKEIKALNAANKFLSLVDTGQYEKSYSETSSLFHAQITKQGWVSKISRARPIFGSVINRKMKKAEYLTSTPGAPDGEYFLVIFQTSFQNKAKAFEFVTTNKDIDGNWRVCGYFIR